MRDKKVAEAPRRDLVREGQVARFSDLIERLTYLWHSLRRTRLKWIRNELHFLTLETLSEVGRSVDIASIGKRIEKRDFPSLATLCAALEAARRDVEENPRALTEVEDVLSVVRELFRTLRRLESVRHSETEYVAIGPTLAHEVESKMQLVLRYFADAKISPSHLRKCVTKKILATEGLLDSLHAGIRSEVAILGHIPGTQVPVDPIRESASRPHLAKLLADYMTVPRPERLARIYDPDPTPDGSGLPGLTLLLALGERSRTEEPPSIDQMLLFTLYKISGISERLLGFKSSVITGSLRVTTLRWTRMARAFVEDQPQELDVVRLITALLDLARDARWRVMYETQVPAA